MDTEGKLTLESKFAAVAREHGVTIYPVDVGKIHPLQSVRLKCQVPLCEFYGVCKVCPPNILNVVDFREALQSYSKAFLVVLRKKIHSMDIFREDFSAELELLEAVAKLELIAFQNGSYLAVGLGVGGCKLCQQCTPPGEPCRHPFKARPSPEGFGIDITQLAREADIPLEWPPIDYVSFMGLLMI